MNTTIAISNRWFSLQDSVEKKNVGVYATRSPNRPNGLGLSCVALESVSNEGTEIHLNISGGDFLDGTPVVDIKPYVTFADSISDARCD